MLESLPDLFAFPCSGCGGHLFCRASLEVDAAHRPLVRDLLLGGRLNTYTCPVCGQGGETPIPVLYRDSRLGSPLAVLYVPPRLQGSGEGPQAGELQRLRRAATEEVATLADMARIVRAWEKQAIRTRGPAGPRVQYRKQKMAVLGRIAQAFERGRLYTASEVSQQILASLRQENQALRSNPTYSPDHLRLGLVEVGLMARDPDGSRYWIAT